MNAGRLARRRRMAASSGLARRRRSAPPDARRSHGRPDAGRLSPSSGRSRPLSDRAHRWMPGACPVGWSRQRHRPRPIDRRRPSPCRGSPPGSPPRRTTGRRPRPHVEAAPGGRAAPSPRCRRSRRWGAIHERRYGSPRVRGSGEQAGEGEAQPRPPLVARRPLPQPVTQHIGRGIGEPDLRQGSGPGSRPWRHRPHRAARARRSGDRPAASRWRPPAGREIVEQPIEDGGHAVRDRRGDRRLWLAGHRFLERRERFLRPAGRMAKLRQPSPESDLVGMAAPVTLSATSRSIASAGVIRPKERVDSTSASRAAIAFPAGRRGRGPARWRAPRRSPRRAPAPWLRDCGSARPRPGRDAAMSVDRSAPGHPRSGPSAAEAPRRTCRVPPGPPPDRLRESHGRAATPAAPRPTAPGRRARRPARAPSRHRHPRAWIRAPRPPRYSGRRERPRHPAPPGGRRPGLRLSHRRRPGDRHWAPGGGPQMRRGFGPQAMSDMEPCQIELDHRPIERVGLGGGLLEGRLLGPERPGWRRPEARQTERRGGGMVRRFLGVLRRAHDLEGRFGGRCPAMRLAAPPRQGSDPPDRHRRRPVSRRPWPASGPAPPRRRQGDCRWQHSRTGGRRSPASLHSRARTPARHRPRPAGHPPPSLRHAGPRPGLARAPARHRPAMPCRRPRRGAARQRLAPPEAGAARQISRTPGSVRSPPAQGRCPAGRRRSDRPARASRLSPAA